MFICLKKGKTISSLLNITTVPHISIAHTFWDPLFFPICGSYLYRDNFSHNLKPGRESRSNSKCFWLSKYKNLEQPYISKRHV